MNGGWTDPLPWLVLAGLPGHVSWLIWLGNNIQATALPRKFVKSVTAVLDLAVVFGGVAAAVAALLWLVGVAPLPTAQLPTAPLPESHGAALRRLLEIYFAACTVNGAVFTLPWIVRRLTARQADVLVHDRAELVDLRPQAAADPEHSRYGRLVLSVPFNESLTVGVHEKRIAVPRLPPQLRGLRIGHVSDVHLTGRVGRRFFEEALELLNAAEPDLIVVTGDLLEHDACRPWIPSTFGRLRAAHGTYFVFGNHDIRVDHERTRDELVAAGLIDVGRTRVHRTIRGVDVVLAGTARPWIREAAVMHDCPPREEALQFRILLSHSPDQLDWARQHDFDLMVAGHVHGGQIQIPPLGAVLAPSRFGVRYACGVFHEPPTVVHVSRGLSGKLPLRFFCPPELTTLVLDTV